MPQVASSQVTPKENQAKVMAMIGQFDYYLKECTAERMQVHGLGDLSLYYPNK